MEIKLHKIVHYYSYIKYSVYIKYIRGKECIHEDVLKGGVQAWRSAVTLNQHLHVASSKSVWAEMLQVQNSAGKNTTID